MKKTSPFLVVIPAFNEEGNIGQVVDKAACYADVCVVDDGSTDKTGARANSIKRTRVIRHEKNEHIARSIQDGMKLAVKHEYDHIITMDAGLSHDPGALPKFMDAPFADLVIGKRTRIKGVPFSRRLLSMTASLAVNAALAVKSPYGRGKYLADVSSGFRCYSLKAVNTILGNKIRSRSFGFHLEVLCLLHMKGCTIHEVPISYTYTGSSLNREAFFDAMAAYLEILRLKNP